jgi:hypothetical protein
MSNALPKFITFAAVFGFALCFAQEPPGKLAVYVFGSSDGGINKSLGGKLLVAMSQSGNYAEISDPGAFQDELAMSGKGDIAYIAQAAKRYGADYVCAVSMTEAFGAYSIIARLARVSDSQVLKIGMADRFIGSQKDLTAVSKELSRQLLPAESYMPSLLYSSTADAATAYATEDAAPPPAPKQCEKTYNKNELLFKVKNGFPAQLKDCSANLAKEMALAALPFGKKAAPVEPKSFMKQCAVDGIKKELPPGFPNKDKIIGSLDNFMQGILNAASAGAGVDPKKLISAVGSMDINGLLSDVKKLASDECVVDEPYEPPSAQTGRGVSAKSKEKKSEESSVSFGIRAGINFSSAYVEYRYEPLYGSGGSRSGSFADILGMQAGFVVDFAASSWFHIQPGLMYIQKGMEDSDGSGVTAHYLELPLLLSLKLSALRLSAGPYFGLCLTSDYGYFDGFDIGLSTGIGFDIGKFYIGAFYDYGFSDMGYRYGQIYNRTLGFNLGINL